MTYIAFAAADSICDDFEALLKQNKIAVPVGSGLESEFLSIVDLFEILKNPNAVIDINCQMKSLRTASGIHDLAAKVLSTRNLPEFKQFIPHLEMIGDAKIGSGFIGQNSKGSILNDMPRKMAELYIGCLAAHVGKNVQLDHPINSTGNNPDVMFEYPCDSDSPVRTWALSIKTIATQQGQTIYERIKEGAGQINSPLCNADIGMVVINTKDAIDQEALLNPSVAFTTIEEAQKAMRDQLQSLVDAACKDRPQAEWDTIFRGKVVRPILFLGQALIILRSPDGKNSQPTSLKMLMAFGADGVCDTDGSAIAYCLNHFMQTIVMGVPGGIGKEPF